MSREKKASGKESALLAEVRKAARQEQFLEVVSAREAHARFAKALDLHPKGTENVALADALGRVLAEDTLAPVDVPSFDRSSVDGFAVRSADTAGASDTNPKRLLLNNEVLACGVEPKLSVVAGTATAIATGGVVPRGADAVAMIEWTDFFETEKGPAIDLRRAVTPGQFVSFAGSDIARGETVLRKGTHISSREIGMLAACGIAEVKVVRRPRAAVLSTGDELVKPGDKLKPGGVYDSNGAIVAAAISEAGGEPVTYGAVPDDEAKLEAVVRRALKECDMVVLSGGTSKGAGDLAYRVVSRLTDPGIVVHGAALKPGKPICLAVTRGKPVIVLPGFPTSAIFTFHEFAAPVIRAFAGLRAEEQRSIAATLARRVTSERGRTEYVLVSLVRGADGQSLAAYPIAKGSGSVTAFGQADGFFAVPPHTETVAAGSEIQARLIGAAKEPAALVIIGSHCVGLDRLVGKLLRQGITVKALNVGSQGGLAAAERGECDIAGIHLMDPASGVYNRPFLTEGLELVPGYGRLQGLVFRPGDPRFEGRSIVEAIAAALADPDCFMVNRNAGSGTRILIDRLLKGARPSGYLAQPKSHGAVAVAVAQRRADWGVAIATVARQYELGFIPLQAEHYDFVLPRARRDRPAVERFLAVLADDELRGALRAHGFSP